MKKGWFISVIMCIACLGIGCKSSEEKDRLHIVTEKIYYEEVQEVADYFMKEYPDIQIEIQLLKQDEEERETEIQKIRTETMAGNGPDVFLLGCTDELIAEENQYEQLFPNINKTMESGVFAVLDEYMEKDEYWESGTYHTEILKSGQYKEKQYIIPLGCTFFVYTHPAEEGKLSGTTLEEWLEEASRTNDEEMKKALFLATFRLMRGRMLQPAVDYEHGEVIFDGNEWATTMVKYIPEYQAISKSEMSSELSNSKKYNMSRVDMLVLPEIESFQCHAVPALTGKRMAAVTEFGAVGMASSNKEKAYEFLMLFLNNRMEAEEYTTVNGYFSLGGAPVQRRSWKKYLELQGISDEESQQAVLASFNELDGAYFPIEAECDLYNELTEILLSDDYTDKELEMQIEAIADEYEKQYYLLAKE